MLALPNLTRISPQIIDTAPEKYFLVLRHELSAHYLALHPIGMPPGRSSLEVDALAAFEASAEPLHLHSACNFREQLVGLNLVLTNGKGGLRTGSVRLADDQQGNRIFFPHVSAVPGQLERVRLLLADGGNEPPLFTAAIAYVLFLNCHPFRDGNGRTARVLFNHLLRQVGMPREAYFPFHEIARRSHGGYEIALRIAEIRGDWEPFLRFILNAIRCHREIAAAAIEGSSHA